MLDKAFAALGAGPTHRELELVAEALRDSGDEKAMAVLEAPLDDDSWQQLVAVAEASGSSYFVALDLKVAVDSGIDALTRKSHGPDENRG